MVYTMWHSRVRSREGADDANDGRRAEWELCHRAIKQLYKAKLKESFKQIFKKVIEKFLKKLENSF